MIVIILLLLLLLLLLFLLLFSSSRSSPTFCTNCLANISFTTTAPFHDHCFVEIFVKNTTPGRVIETTNLPWRPKHISSGNLYFEIWKTSVVQIWIISPNTNIVIVILINVFLIVECLIHRRTATPVKIY